MAKIVIHIEMHRGYCCWQNATDWFSCGRCVMRVSSSVEKAKESGSARQRKWKSWRYRQPRRNRKRARNLSICGSKLSSRSTCSREVNITLEWSNIAIRVQNIPKSDRSPSKDEESGNQLCADKEEQAADNIINRLIGCQRQGRKSQLRFVILLEDKDGRAKSVHYGSGRCKRVMKSVMESEIHSLITGFDNASEVKQMLKEITGILAPIEAYIDSRTVFDVVEKRDEIRKSACKQTYDLSGNPMTRAN